MMSVDDDDAKVRKGLQLMYAMCSGICDGKVVGEPV